MSIKNTDSYNVFGTWVAPIKVHSSVKEVELLKVHLGPKRNTLIKQVFNEQKLKPKKHDWVKSVEII